MTLNQLNYALELQKTLNFKKAADHLSISQPALSIQIQKLEEEIGIKLFNRNSTPLEITRDGGLFLIRAQEIITQTRQLRNFVNEIKDDFTGTLTVGIIPTLAPFLVPLFSADLQNNHPNLQLVFKEEITETVVNRVRSGELDAGIISTPIHVYGIQSIPLFYERFFVYTSDQSEKTESEIRIQDINHDELWLLDEGNCFRDQINDFCDLSSIRKDKKFVYHSNSIDALIRIVDTRGGMTMLPELTTLSLTEQQEENIRTISGTPKAREIGLIVTTNYDKARYIDLLVKSIQSNIPSHLRDRKNYDVVDPGIKMK